MLYSELQFNLLTLNIYILESNKVVVESFKYVTFYGTNILKVEIFKNKNGLFTLMNYYMLIWTSEYNI
jgi:hypothetical protein